MTRSPWPSRPPRGGSARRWCWRPPTGGTGRRTCWPRKARSCTWRTRWGPRRQYHRAHGRRRQTSHLRALPHRRHPAHPRRRLLAGRHPLPAARHRRIDHGYQSPRPGQIDFGWELCSTGGKPRTITVTACRPRGRRLTDPTSSERAFAREPNHQTRPGRKDPRDRAVLGVCYTHVAGPGAHNTVTIMAEHDRQRVVLPTGKLLHLPERVPRRQVALEVDHFLS
jgi:hypothetical protein